VGFEVREAENGRAAVDVFSEWSPNLILMDIRMPGMNGMEATRLIRSTSAGREVKIVAVTAHALAEERQEILAAGCDAFIRKPVAESQIFGAVSRLLGTTFTYEKTEPTPTVVPVLRGADLSELEPALVRRLQLAAEQLDAQLCAEAIVGVEESDPELASRLRGLVREARFRELLAALDGITDERDS
jgi:CheY-like chemotaxis protein